MSMLLKQRLATASPVASRLWHFGTKNMSSRRYASGSRALPSDEERELYNALKSRAVSAPFFVKGSQRLREPLKLFLTGLGPKAGHRSDTVNDAKVIEIGADGVEWDGLQALLQVGARNVPECRTAVLHPARQAVVQFPCWVCLPLAFWEAGAYA